MLPDTLKVITGDDAAELAITMLKQPKAPDEQTEAFMKALYAWKPNLTGADQETLREIVLVILTYLQIQTHTFTICSSILFDLRLPETIFEKLYKS